jgi:hypothetical protein
MVDPEAKLEEELVVRPTSEAIIWNTYKGWIQSYRDLPILVQPMGECCTLGNAHAPLPAHSRIFMARGPHRPLHQRRGDR